MKVRAWGERVSPLLKDVRSSLFSSVSAWRAERGRGGGEWGKPLCPLGLGVTGRFGDGEHFERQCALKGPRQVSATRPGPAQRGAGGSHVGSNRIFIVVVVVKPQPRVFSPH